MYASESLIDHIFKTARTIAVVGFSGNPARPSHYVAAYLQDRGYRIVPVNPGLEGQEFLGETVYKDLASVPFPVDMVDIFRNSDDAGPVTDQAVAIGAKVAGAVEAKCTPAASVAAGEQVKQITAQIAKLKESKGPEAEIKALEASQKAARLSQLKAMDWKTLWGIPAIMSAAIFLVFMVAFKEPVNRGGNTVVTDVPTGERP